MALQVVSTTTAEDVDCNVSSDDDLKTNSKLKRPPGLARVISQDDSCIDSIEPDYIATKSKKKIYPQTPNPISNTKKKKTKWKKSSSENQKIVELEAKIKSLTRDNRVLQRKLEKIESTSGKKQKKMDSEREMRLAANKERFALKQKLEKLQKAIAVRLKLLGVDFSKIDDITEALDTAFNVIQKLAKQLQQKEEEFNKIKMKITFYSKMKKEFNALTEKNKHLVENGVNFQYEIEKLRENVNVLNEQNETLNSDLDGVNRENVQLIGQNEELLADKTDLETNVREAMETMKKLKSELQIMTKQFTELNTKYKNKCNELNELSKKYEIVKENTTLKQTQYDKSIKLLQNKLKKVEISKEDEKEKEVKFKSIISSLHEEIAEKDDWIKSQKKKIKQLKKELDMAGFGDNKKFSQMSLLKTNVENMHNIIRDKDNQLKMLRNKLKSLQKELDSKS